MSCFTLPSWVIHEIDKIRKKFLWHGITAENKKMNLVNWPTVCTPKKLGGLRVMDLKTFNRALLMKLCWHWSRLQTNLWKPLLGQMGLTDKLMPAVELFQKMEKTVQPFWCISVCRIPGNELSISFWEHDWGCGILKNRFEVLYTFAEQKFRSLYKAVQEIGSGHLVNPELSDMAQTQLQTLQGELQVLQLDSNSQDGITWQWNSAGVFFCQKCILCNEGRTKNIKQVQQNLVHQGTSPIQDFWMVSNTQ
jgi:hypothetical protein